MNDNVGCGLVVVYLTAAVLCVWGWVLNLLAIADTWVWPPDGVLVLRVIGVFLAPIGAAMGWFV